MKAKERSIGRFAAALAIGLGALSVAGLPAVLTPAPAAAQMFSDGYSFLKAVRDRDVLKAKSLIDKPGSTIVNHRDYDSGETALIIAVKRRDAPWMGFLIQNGADVNLADRQGQTPLMVAAQNSFSEGVNILLISKAQINATSGKGETALIKAVHARDEESVRLLLANGADPDRTDNLTGMSAREYAARDIRSGPIARMLAEAKARKTTNQVGPSL